MRITAFVALALALAGSACSSTREAVPRIASSGSGLDLTDMDLSVDPSRDFYRYVNGGWLERNPVPADESLWNVFNEVRARNEAVLHEVLEAAATRPSDDLQRKLGDFYFTGMDEASIAAQGTAPLAWDLAEIEACADASALPQLLANLHGVGADGFFSISAGADMTDATMNILFLRQDVGGLPEKDYYLRDDAASIELRAKYAKHVERMFVLFGANESTAKSRAESVLEIETELARASFGAVEMRDPKKRLNKITLAQVQELTPHFDWEKYWSATRLAPQAQVNLIAPEYFKAFDALIAARDIAQVRSYLSWQLIHGSAEFLSREIEAEHFDFFGRTLSGTAEQRPRWKRVMEASGGAMGELLSQGFVARAFSPQAKERCQKMVDDLIAAFEQRIQALEWMGPQTRARALEKLAAIRTKIGYPDRWRDWSGLEIERDSYFLNQRRAAKFNRAWNLGKLGQPVDKDEFRMPAYLVNASYSPSNNDISFPAGILQPPFFSESYDDALNYGAMGAVIGHELTHGFDDSGSQFDAKGNLANWWTDADRKEFERRAQIVVEQFSGYVAIDDLHVNGKLTLGENLADLGGLTIAYAALQRAQQKQRLAPIDGFTPAQRFFIAWARAWRTNYTPARLKLQVNTNPHSPGNFRAIGPLSNLESFQEAFGFADDAAVMRPRVQRALVW